MSKETDAGRGAVGAPIEASVRPVAEVRSARLRWHLPTPDADPVAKFLDNETHPLYDQAALDAAVASALDERKFVHAESSRIYARLASAVRAGADDATLARLLRDEVTARHNV